MNALLAFVVGLTFGGIPQNTPERRLGPHSERDRNESSALTVLLSRLQAMQSDWDSLDNKLLGIAGASAATSGIFIGAMSSGGSPRGWEWVGLTIVGVLTLIVATVATWQYWPREMHHAPKLLDITKNLEHPRAVRSWVDAVGEAIELNRPIVERKAKWVSWLLIVLIAQVAVAMGTGAWSLSLLERS